MSYHIRMSVETAWNALHVLGEELSTTYVAPFAAYFFEEYRAVIEKLIGDLVSRLSLHEIDGTGSQEVSKISVIASATPVERMT